MHAVRQEPFRDRTDAGERLAAALAHLRGSNPLVLGIPRGGVVVGRTVADRLGGDLDIVLVRKMGAPGNEEFAIGAVDETGHAEVSGDAGRLGLSPSYLEREAARQFERIVLRRRLYSPHHSPYDPRGRTVIVVDDGLATGATMHAALAAVRRRAPGRLIAAVPVASPDRLPSIGRLADEVVCLSAPADLRSVGEHYAWFPAVEDAEVIRLLDGTTDVASAAHPDIMRFSVDGVALEGDLDVPPGATACIVFVHGSGSSRRSVRNRQVARAMRERGFATLLFDLLSADEDVAAVERFNIAKLARRLDGVLARLREMPSLTAIPLGLFGASTGAAAALAVAARRSDIGAVVSRGGRPDLAGADVLARVAVPTLLIVGSADAGVIPLNRSALSWLSGVAELVLVPHATHLFEEPGAMERVASLAGDWFARWLSAG